MLYLPPKFHRVGRSSVGPDFRPTCSLGASAERIYSQ